jgi:hypothetical protein
MNTLNIRRATINDIPFLTKAIIEAEMSGTEVLSYSTIFGLNNNEITTFISEMLSEEIDDCEISISSFLIAEINGQTAAALSGWLENANGIPSAILKGNLLNYYLPPKSFEKAATLLKYTKDLHFDYIPNTFQIGAGYVAEEFRGNKLLGLLTQKLLEDFHNDHPLATEVYAQIFSCNIPSLKTYEKAGFTVISTKESFSNEITKIFPSSRKLLLKKIF